MMRCFQTGIALLTLLLVSGCATRGKIDLLETRLRHQEDTLYEMESELETSRNELASTRKDADQLRAQLTAQGKSTLLPEQATALYQATGIEIDKLRSGGLDRDGQPGDDIFTAAIVPHDTDGELVKLAGDIELALFDLSRPKGNQRIGQWKFSSKESRDYWHKGFLGSGYLFKLPWQQSPSRSQLVLHAQLTTADGRKFDTSETIRVNPGASASNIDSEFIVESEQEIAPGKSFEAAPKMTTTEPSDSETPNVFQAAGDETLVAPAFNFEPTSEGDRKANQRRTSTAPPREFPTLEPTNDAFSEPDDLQQAGDESFAPSQFDQPTDEESPRRTASEPATNRSTQRFAPTLSLPNRSQEIPDFGSLEDLDESMAEEPKGSLEANSTQERPKQPLRDASLRPIGLEDDAIEEKPGELEVSPFTESFTFEGDDSQETGEAEFDPLDTPSSQPKSLPLEIGPAGKGDRKSQADSDIPVWAR